MPDLQSLAPHEFGDVKVARTDFPGPDDEEVLRIVLHGDDAQFNAIANFYKKLRKWPEANSIVEASLVRMTNVEVKTASAHSGEGTVELELEVLSGEQPLWFLEELTPLRKCDILITLGGILEQWRNRCCYHHALTPWNIWVSELDGEQRIRLFGAYVSSEYGLGTPNPNWSAPEVRNYKESSHSKPDQWADSFSFGLIAWYLIFGVNPWTVPDADQGHEHADVRDRTFDQLQALVNGNQYALGDEYGVSRSRLHRALQQLLCAKGRDTRREPFDELMSALRAVSASLSDGETPEKKLTRAIANADFTLLEDLPNEPNLASDLALRIKQALETARKQRRTFSCLDPARVNWTEVGPWVDITAIPGPGALDHSIKNKKLHDLQLLRDTHRKGLRKLIETENQQRFLECVASDWVDAVRLLFPLLDPPPAADAKHWKRIFGAIRSLAMWNLLNEQWLPASELSMSEQAKAVLEGDRAVTPEVVELLEQRLKASAAGALEDNELLVNVVARCKDQNSCGRLLELAGDAAGSPQVRLALAKKGFWELFTIPDEAEHRWPLLEQAARDPRHDTPYANFYATLLGRNRAIFHFRTTPGGRTVLHLAAASGAIEVVRAIRDNNVLLHELTTGHFVVPDFRDDHGWTPLHVAAAECPSDRLKQVLDLLAGIGCDPEACDYEGQTPGHLVARRAAQRPPGSDERGTLVALLALPGANSRSPDWGGRRPADIAQNDENDLAKQPD